jgi:hypothetical protein
MMVVDEKKISHYKFLTNFVIINLGLDLDRIRTQQKAGSGSRFNKKYLDPDSVKTVTSVADP